MQGDQQVEIEAPETKELKQFKAYSSIQLSTRDKVIKAIEESLFTKPDVIWVASEKIHGSNFSIHFNGQVAKYGRRTDFLSKEIPVPCENPGQYFNESFYDARNLVTKFHNRLPTIYDNIKKIYPEMMKFAVYGEYFGGNWPEDKEHPDAKKGLKAVQKGVSYTPNHEFLAFDVLIITEDKKFWVDVMDIPKVLAGQIESIPIYKKGTFGEVFEMETKIDSTIPELLGLQKLQKNIIEGMVIRPNTDLRLPKYNERVILKKKNAQFAQVVSAPKNKEKKEKKEKPLDPEIAPFVEFLQQYLNFNRIESVTSKYPDLKDRNKLKNEILKDILTDAAKDEWKEPESAELKKKMSTEFEKLIMKEVNSYFVKH